MSPGVSGHEPMTDSWVTTPDGATAFVRVVPRATAWMIVVDAWPQVPVFSTEALARDAAAAMVAARGWKVLASDA